MQGVIERTASGRTSTPNPVPQLEHCVLSPSVRSAPTACLARVSCYYLLISRRSGEKTRPKKHILLHSCIIIIHHHLCLNRGGRWGTTDDFTASFVLFYLFSIALWNLANSRPVHSPVSYTHLTLPTT